MGRPRGGGRVGRDIPAPDARAEIPLEVREAVTGLGLLAGGANVIMQLSLLPIGHGVAESMVESGRVDRHPVKRLRTTTAFLVVTLLGTEAERRALRDEITRVHRRVRSGPDDEVAYDALDPELQHWVAACLLQGLLDVDARLHGAPASGRRLEVLYEHGKRFGSDLQVRPSTWPADAAAFQRWWDEQTERIELDDLTRAYLTTIADGSFAVAPLGRWGRPLAALGRPWNRFLTLGFLPEPFRGELGLPWDDRRQRRHDRVFGALFRVAARAPRPLREFPLNLYLRDTRHRLAAGRPVL